MNVTNVNRTLIKVYRDFRRAVRGFLRKTCAIQGHFVLTSGRHSGSYVDKHQVFTDPRKSENIALLLAHDVYCRGYTTSPPLGIDVVLGPAMSGALLAHDIGRCLNEYYALPPGNSMHYATTCFAEKSPEGKGFFIAERFHALIRGNNILITEDTITTGGSVEATIKAVRAAGGIPIAVACIWNRSNKRRIGKGKHSIPIIALVHGAMKTYPKEKCPLCAKNIPFSIQVGHAKRAHNTPVITHRTA